MKTDVAVIGAGPAGLCAAVSAAKNGASVTLIEREDALGGILKQCVHNGFGLHFFGEELTGPEYAARCVDMLNGLSVRVMTETMALSIDDSLSIRAVNPENGMFILDAKAIVLAMGCRERTRGALSIPGTRPAGVYTAGSAQRLVNIDGYMPGKSVVVLGSGDIGLIMARRMVWEGAEVKLVCELMPYSSGLNRNIVQCLNDYNIPLKFNHTVTRIHGRERMTGVTIAEVNPATRAPIVGSEFFVECDTLLLSVGLIPENELTRQAGIEIDPITGGAVVDQYRATSQPGVFACGNALHVHDLADNASKEAEIAGASAAAYAHGAQYDGEKYRVVPGRGVRYCVPQYISGDASDVEIFFRSDAAYKNPRIMAQCGDKTLLDKRLRIVTPGEMEVLRVNAPHGDITIEVLAKEGA